MKKYQSCTGYTNDILYIRPQYTFVVYVCMYLCMSSTRVLARLTDPIINNINRTSLTKSATYRVFMVVFPILFFYYVAIYVTINKCDTEF